MDTITNFSVILFYIIYFFCVISLYKHKRDTYLRDTFIKEGLDFFCFYHLI